MDSKGFTLTPITPPNNEEQAQITPEEGITPEVTGQSSTTTETQPEVTQAPPAAETTQVTTTETTSEAPVENTPPATINYEGYTSPEQLNELKKTWGEENKPQPLQFANEQAQFINEYLKNGGVLDDKFIRNQTVNYDDYNGEISVENGVELLTREMMDLGNLTKAQATHQIKRKYPNLYKDINESESSDEEIATFNSKYDDDAMSLSIDAMKVLPALKEEQKKYQLPEVKSTEPTPEQIEEARVAKENYLQGASAALNDFKGYDLDLGDDVKINFPVTDEGMGYVKELLTNPDKQNSYFRDNYVVDGKIDFAKMAKEEWIKRNFDSIVKEAANQLITMGKEKFAKEEGIQPTLGDRSLQTGEKVLSLNEQMSNNVKGYGH